MPLPFCVPSKDEHKTSRTAITILPVDGTEDLTNKYNQVHTRFSQLSKGQEPASKDRPEDMNAIKIMA